jgi:hypothetical protein
MRATILVRPKSGILDPQGAAVATSSSPRLRGSTPQAHTTTICTTTRPIISQTTPGN